MPENSQNAFLLELNKTIKSEIGNPNFTLDDLCRSINLSRSQLHRKLKVDVGLSISLYIRKFRLEKAKELLTDENLNISEISYQVGFSNPQSLSKYFTKEYGISPSQFRRNLKHNDSFNDANIHIEASNVGVQTSSKYKTSLPKAPILNKTPKTSRPSLIPKRNQFLLPFVVISLLSLLMYSVISILLRTSKNVVTNLDPSLAIIVSVEGKSDESLQLSKGVLENLFNSISRNRKMRVTSLGTSDYYVNSQEPYADIATKLGVSYLLTGKVKVVDEQFYIQFKIIRSHDSYVESTTKFAGNFEDHFDFINNLQHDISRILLHKSNTPSLAPVFKPSREAYNHVLLGKKLVMDRTKSSLEASITHLDKALEIEPKYTEALLCKANAYNLLSNIGYDNRTITKQKSQEYALQCIKLNPESGMAYAILGNNYRDNRQWKQSKIAYEIALKYRPYDAFINYWYSLLLRETGQVKKAVKYSGIASKLDPLYPVIHAGHLVNLAYSEDKEASEQSIVEKSEFFSNNFLFQWAVARYATSRKDYEKGITLYERALNLNPSFTAANIGIIFCKGKLGMNEEVQQFISSHKEETGYNNYAKALAYLSINEIDSCFQFLNKAIELQKYPIDLLVDPRYDMIRNDFRYSELLEKLNLEEQQQDSFVNY